MARATWNGLAIEGRFNESAAGSWNHAPTGGEFEVDEVTIDDAVEWESYLDEYGFDLSMKAEAHAIEHIDEWIEAASADEAARRTF